MKRNEITAREKMQTRHRAMRLLRAVETRMSLNDLANLLGVSYSLIHRYKWTNRPGYNKALKIINLIERKYPLQRIIEEKLEFHNHNITLRETGDPLLLEMASEYAIRNIPLRPRLHKVVSYDRDSIPLASIIASKLSIPLVTRPDEFLYMWQKGMQRSRVLIVEAISRYTSLKTLMKMLHIGGAKIQAFFFLVFIEDTKKILPKVPISYIIKIKNRRW